MHHNKTITIFYHLKTKMETAKYLLFKMGFISMYNFIFYNRILKKINPNIYIMPTFANNT